MNYESNIWAELLLIRPLERAVSEKHPNLESWLKHFREMEATSDSPQTRKVAGQIRALSIIFGMGMRINE